MILLQDNYNRIKEGDIIVTHNSTKVLVVESDGAEYLIRERMGISKKKVKSAIKKAFKIHKRHNITTKVVITTITGTGWVTYPQSAD